MTKLFCVMFCNLDAKKFCRKNFLVPLLILHYNVKTVVERSEWEIQSEYANGSGDVAMESRDFH